MVPYSRFNAAKDAEKLRTALKGWKTDHNAITDILAARSNQQRQEIAKYYKQQFGKELVEVLKSETSGVFEDLVVALVRNPTKYLCMQLHSSLTHHLGVDVPILVEVLCTRENAQIEDIIHTYQASAFMS